MSSGLNAVSVAVAPEGGTYTFFAAALDGVWSYTFPRPETIHTLIATNQSRLAQRYGAEAANSVLQHLYDLADRSQVQGLVIDVGNATTYPQVAAAYAAWDVAPPISNTLYANQVANAVRDVVVEQTRSYSNTQFLVLVGDDAIIPFHRLPDGTANYVLPYTNYAPITGTIAYALADHMTLSDDPYASLHPVSLPDGRVLSIPDLSTGRLVESPSDIIATIDAFLAGDQLNDHSLTFVSGADNYLLDTAYAISDTLSAARLTTSGLIGNQWTATDLVTRFLQGSNDLVALNQHTYHDKLLAPDNTFITPQQVLSATADLQRNLVYALGCHAGLSLPDEVNGSIGLDFPQAFTRRGAPFIGNTGYGWATLYAIGLTERLALYFTQELAPTSGNTAYIG